MNLGLFILFSDERNNNYSNYAEIEIIKSFKYHNI